MSKRWLVVNIDGRVVGGPYLWDGKQKWTPPETGELVLESEYLAKLKADLDSEDESSDKTDA